ncbi:MAG: glycosyltransferase [Candidatus Sedimenticola sp. (ex Thyasira tokunagai)]
MIPKIIHYCWFGGADMPPLAKECVSSWKRHLPDYELIKWDESNAPRNCFTEYHLEKGNWAFVSDYVRLHALYECGGVYLDTDVEVIKSLDTLLDNNGFVAYEEEDRVNNAVAGSVRGNIFFKDCMSYMTNRFEQGDNYHISPVVTTKVLNTTDYDVTIFDSDYFYPYNPYDVSNDIKIFMYHMIKQDTYAIHHWAKSWDGNQIINTDNSQEYSRTGLCTYVIKVCSSLSRKLKVVAKILGI